MRAAPLALVVALAAAASAQTPADSLAADSAAAVRAAPRAVTVALPERGVFYYRAGPPGGVRIRSRRGRPQAAEAPLARVPAADTTARLAARTGEPTAAEGITRLDLALLEERLLRAIDRRLGSLDTGRPRASDPLLIDRDRPPVVVVTPGAPVAPARPSPVSPPPPSPDRGDRPPAAQPTPAAPAEGTPPIDLVEEIERAILDTGLFRTTRVHFEFGEAGLLPVSEESLRAVAAVLRRYPALRVEIGGHTDAVSSDAFNLALSERRALSVASFLVDAGVDAGRLRAAGYGEGRPVATNETETGRALNRRVEFRVLNPGAADREQRRLREAAPTENETLRRLLREEIERARREDG